LNENEIEFYERLGIVWKRDRMRHLRAYYKEYGSLTDITISSVYVYNGEEVKIGQHLNNLRQLNKRGLLSEEESAELNSMDAKYENKQDRVIARWISYLESYYKIYGNGKIITTNEMFSHKGKLINIYQISYNLRTLYSEGDLDEMQIKKLADMGFEFTADRLRYARAYYNQFGSLSNVKYNTIFRYKGKQIRMDLNLKKLIDLHAEGKLTASEKDLLEDMGIKWINYAKSKYDMDILREYYQKVGTLANIQRGDIYMYKRSKIDVGAIIYRLRKQYKKGKLKKATVDELNSMGMVWQKKAVFKNKLEPIIDYYNNFGSIADIAISDEYEYKGQVVKIGFLIGNLRRRKKKLTEEQVKKLDAMGMVWSCKAEYVK
jgi:hypothetical protein